MTTEIVLVGNPNTGKTTLYNSLTDSNERASNWHGVTVSVISKKIKYKNREYVIYDLPGIYSLHGYSNEEKIAIKFLNKNKEKIIVNICDANNLHHNLFLSQQLITAGYKVILAVNMSNEIKKFNYEMLSQDLDVPIIEIDARKKTVKNIIFNYIEKYSNKIKTQNINKNIKIPYKTQEIIKKYAINKNNKNLNLNKIDKLILNKKLFPLFFLFLIFLIFYFTFGPIGTLVLNLFNKFLDIIFNYIIYFISSLNCSLIIKTFFIDGIILSIKTLLSFVPQIIILITILNMLEDSGLMSRIAFMLDSIFQKIGLTGKAFFSLILGYGCTTTAILTTRNLENKNLRMRTVFLLPFISCSAKLPVFLVIASLFFDSYKYIFVFLLYIFSIILFFIFAFIYNKRFTNKDDNNFILEMPKYRLPYFKKVINDSLFYVKEFLFKVGTIIIFFSSLIWFLQNFSISLNYLNGENFTLSILYNFSKILSPLFYPLGLNNVGVVVAIIFGIVAKEMIVVGLCMINNVSTISELTSSLLLPTSVCNFSSILSVIFLIFVLLYSPCVSAVATVKNELGKKVAFKFFINQFLIAYITSLIFKIFLSNLNYLYLFLIIFFLYITIKFMVKFNCKNKPCKGCYYGCK